MANYKDIKAALVIYTIYEAGREFCEGVEERR